MYPLGSFLGGMDGELLFGCSRRSRGDVLLVVGWTLPSHNQFRLLYATCLAGVDYK